MGYLNLGWTDRLTNRQCPNFLELKQSLHFGPLISQQGRIHGGISGVLVGKSIDAGIV